MHEVRQLGVRMTPPFARESHGVNNSDPEAIERASRPASRGEEAITAAAVLADAATM